MDTKRKWKEIKGYEGKYIISSLGEIISLPRYKQNHSKTQYVEPKEMFRYINKRNKYEYVMLYSDGKEKNIRVHRLVAEAFIPNPKNKPCVNHKNREEVSRFIFNENIERAKKELDNLKIVEFKGEDYE